MSLYNKVESSRLGSVIVNYFSRAVSVLSVYLFVPFYMRILGEEQFGLIAFSTLLLSIVSICDIGMTATITRVAALEKNTQTLQKVYANLSKLMLVLVTAIVAILVIFAELIVTNWLQLSNVAKVADTAFTIRLMALAFVPHFQFVLALGCLIGLQKQVMSNILLTAYALAKSGIVLLPLFFMPDIRLFFAWQLGISILFYLLGDNHLKRYLGNAPKFTPKIDLRTIVPHLSFARNMFLISLISVVNTQTDKAIASAFFSLSDFTKYALAGILAQLPVTIASPLVGAMYPRLLSLVNVDKSRLLAEYGAYNMFVTYFASVGAASLIIFPREFLEIWLFGTPVTRELVDLVRVLSIGGLFLGLGLGPYYVCLALGDTKRIAQMAFATLCVSIPLTALLTHRYGLLGLSMPWVFLNACNFVLISIIASRHFPKTEWRASFAKTVLLPIAIGFCSVLMAKTIATTFGSNNLVSIVLVTLSAVLGLIAVWSTVARKFY